MSNRKLSSRIRRIIRRARSRAHVVRAGSRSADLPVFHYDVLKGGEIRVLSFEKQDDTKEPVRLTIRHIPRESTINENGELDITKPAYLALSYSWGKGPQDRLIILNGCKFYVSASLESALRHIRQHRKTRAIDPLWIDAICISQLDNAERSEQVVHMKEVYENASQVIVWLGDEISETTKLASTILENHIKALSDNDLEKILTGAVSIPNGTKIGGYEGFGAFSLTEPPAGAWEAFGSDLMKRAWWKRMWVIQEIVVSWRTPPVVMCGPYIYSWTSLELAAVHAQDSLPHTFSYTEEEIEKDDLYLPNVRWKAAYRRRLGEGQQLPILEMMSNNVSCAATNPRDMIYSLLGLATDIKSVPVDNERRLQTNEPSLNTKTELICDYEKLVEEVYTDFVRVHANTHRSLDIICFSRHPMGQPKEQLSLPSWVPDWRNLWQTGSMHLPHVTNPRMEYRYDASPGVDPVFEFVGTDGLLVSGICFDTVRKVGDHSVDTNSYTDPFTKQFYDFLLGWRKVALGPNFENKSHSYPYIFGEGSLLDAFKRTISCDKNRYGQKVNVQEGLFDPIACYHIYFDPTNSFIEDEEYSIWLRSDRYEDQSFGHAERVVQLRTRRRRFFVTEQGFFGLGTSDTEIGDKVVVLSGCSVPVILRKNQSNVTTDSRTMAALAEDKQSEEYWYFVGEAFVTGLMDGEVVQKGGTFDQKFLLR